MRNGAVGRVLALVGAILLASACGTGGGDDDGAGGPASTTGPGGSASGETPDPAAASARLVLVAEVTQPTALAVRPDDDALYVAEKTGQVRRIADGQTGTGGEVTTVVDLSGDVSGGSEQGLLGLVFSPDGSRLYVDYTDTAGATRVVAYAFADGQAHTASRRELLRVPQPFTNHNGGQLAFGPDDHLYISFGDGGGAGDPNGNAQNLGTLLGTILRIDPEPSGGSPYTVPGDNPFVDRDGARGEIWAYGLRNPWRFTFDRETGAIWIGDVGATAREEIDFLAADHPGGANFGWPLLEGTRQAQGGNPEGGVLPLFEYGRDDGCSVIGGYVYRGSLVPSLQGIYVYGDACSGRVWGLVEQDGRLGAQAELSVEGLDQANGGRYSISSFGEDAAGELYALSLNGGVYRFET